MTFVLFKLVYQQHNIERKLGIISLEINQENTQKEVSIRCDFLSKSSLATLVSISAITIKSYIIAVFELFETTSIHTIQKSLIWHHKNVQTMKKKYNLYCKPSGHLKGMMDWYEFIYKDYPALDHIFGQTFFTLMFLGPADIVFPHLK